MDVIGLWISQGRVVSAQEGPTDATALLFTTNKQAIIINTNWPATNTAGIYTAVGAHYPLVINGVNIGDDATSPIPGLQPRNAAGGSQEGRYPYLVTTQCRQ